MASKLLILLGGWTVQFLEVGTLKSFSVLFSHIVNDIDITISQLGTYIGLFHAISMAFGVVANILLGWISPRLLCMIGGLLGSVGLMLCSTSETNIQIAICLFLSGLGFAMSILPSQVSVISAFEDNYLLPFCVSAMGAGVGMMLLPLLTQKFLDIYSWRGAVLLLGAVNLHIVVAGAVFQRNLLQRASTGDISNADATASREASMNSSVNSLEHDTDDVTLQTENHAQEASQPRRCCLGVRTLILTAYLKSGASVFRQYPIVTYMIIAAYLHGISYAGWTIFVIPNAEAKGFEEHTAVFLALIGGIGNTIGRLLPGALNFLKREVFTARISFLVFGITGAIPLCLNMKVTHFSVLGVFASINGLALGAKAISKSAASVDVVPEPFSSTALAFTLVCSGMGELTGGWAAGRILDITGSLDTAFLFLGCVDIVGVLVLLMSLAHEKINECEGRDER